MAADRPRFQFATRDLLEIVFWIAVFIGSLRAAILLSAEKPSRLELGIKLILICTGIGASARQLMPYIGD